jgi:twitching motility protein PilT
MENRRPYETNEDSIPDEMFGPTASAGLATVSLAEQTAAAAIAADDDSVPLEMFGSTADRPAWALPPSALPQETALPNLDALWRTAAAAPVATPSEPLQRPEPAEQRFTTPPPTAAAAPAANPWDEWEWRNPVAARAAQAPALSQPAAAAVQPIRVPEPIVAPVFAAQTTGAREPLVAPDLAVQPLPGERVAVSDWAAVLTSVLPAAMPSPVDTSSALPAPPPFVAPRRMPLAPPIPPLDLEAALTVPPSRPAPSASFSPAPVPTSRPLAAPRPPVVRPAQTASPMEESFPMEFSRTLDMPAAPESRSAVPVAHLPSSAALPTTRAAVRHEAPHAPPKQARSGSTHAELGVDQLLRVAASRGASTLYLSSNMRPSVRIDGQVQPLDGASVLGVKEVEALLLSLTLAHTGAALPPGAAEWSFDVPDVGHVRCMSFKDHRGPGAVFRIVPVRPVAADQLGLSLEIQSLALEREGLVLVAGPRSSGKGTVIGGLLDLIKRTRRAYVISVEREVNVVSEPDGAFISQREARGGLDDILTVARAALRENPDVLVLPEVRSAPLMNLALEAAASGQLVIAGFTAPSASGAIERIIDLYPPEFGRQVQLSLAQHLRAVVGQVLLPKIGGGRMAARELLLNTPAVAHVLAEGKAWQLPVVIEAARKQGMVPVSEVLVGLAQSGVVAVDDAYRYAPDPTAFLDGLKRLGIDTAFAQHLS